ncbi:MAG: leucine--tRNA ligase [Chitinophagaceae bacterium]|nr:leucine--tRNA ligase [Chitinophagaceae bacterium]
MEYKFRDIEKKWQQQWINTNAYKVSNVSDKPKFYVLDMFPYPSGAGLHVGHPLGYIASDIYSRFKRLKGFNVLHPMGYDAFGLPAEQYAIEHGVHPAVSTDQNINNFRRQLDNIGFCYDWDREVRTCDPGYYKWTQWIFLQLFNSFYNRKTNKAEKIDVLIASFEAEGNATHPIPNSQFPITAFTATEWKAFDEKTQQDILMQYRLAYCGYGEVNWCEALGTVLANDEVVNGVSERGGHPVVKKKLRQWYLRITEYADRLLEGLERIEFSESMKEMQTNWIGKSSGAEITFEIKRPPLTPPEGGDWQAAEQNRDNPTEEENRLWQRLRANQTGHHIRRQHIIDQYIVDFISIDKKVTIEVDGGYHNDAEQKQYDEVRTAFLKELGYEELRFTNEEVRNNIDAVVEAITQKLNSKPSVGQVSPSGEDLEGATLTVYTTRPDTIFGVDFMVIAPELDLVDQIKSAEQTTAVDEYIAYVKSRSERERQAEKKISGVFTGAYAVNPFDGREIPIWISEYVLAGYGTGAIMAVPCGDDRDFKFAQHFNIPITNIIGKHFNGEEANATKDAVLENSGFLNGTPMREAAEIVINKLEELGIGTRKVNFRMRDAAFSRQRYWGEPFPIQWKGGTAYPLSETELPLLLPEVDSYSPGPEGEGPLANIPEWVAKELETNTMPGYAGSSWYFLRYMDPKNEHAFCDRTVSDYWNQVDLYIGGTEHAVGHLLYSRMWTKTLYDLGHIGHDEPFKKLVNQGMIQGASRFVYRINGTNTFVSKDLLKSEEEYEGKKLDKLHVDVNFVDGYELDVEAFKKWRNNEHANAEFILENDKYICGSEVEKMSKSKFNTVNPDDLVNKYGADTFRMYEMFLGPVEISKPWDTKGIEGVHRFLKKLWRLFYDEVKGQVWNNDKATDAELKVLHKTIKKIEDDTERFSFNTGVSTFMIAVNELSDLKCHKKEILEPLLVLLAPYAPHIAEELYRRLQVSPSGGDLEGAFSILDANFPKFEAKYVTESTKDYPVAINGKTRTELTLDLSITQQEVEAIVLANETVQKWLEGKQPKKIIYVKNKMINVVI